MDIEQYLRDHDIAYERYEHAPVYTVEDAATTCAHVPGIRCKNIFVRTKKKDRLVLVTLPAQKSLDLAVLAEKLETKKLGLATQDDLKNFLNVEPGAVSPLGLINDIASRTEFVVDTEVANAEQISVHPNRHDVSLVLSKDMFARYLATLKQKVTVLEL
jgi:Ala-tRNA(Pro) deacylase